MVTHIEPADLAEADANAADYPTVAAQQCGLGAAREAAIRLRQSGLLSDAQLADRLDALSTILRAEDFRHEMQHLRSSSEIDRLFQEAASLIQSLSAEIARCHARLEIDHEFVMGENDLERREIPMAERSNHIDGIECRDATIKEQDRQIDAMRARIAERDELIAAFVRANDEGPGLIDCIDNSGELYTSAGLDRAIRSARALLNKDRQP